MRVSKCQQHHVIEGPKKVFSNLTSDNESPAMVTINVTYNMVTLKVNHLDDTIFITSLQKSCV